MAVAVADGGGGGSKRTLLSSVRRNGSLASDECRLTAAATWCHKKEIYGSPPLPTSGKNSQPDHRAMSALVAGLTAEWTIGDDFIWTPQTTMMAEDCRKTTLDMIVGGTNWLNFHWAVLCYSPCSWLRLIWKNYFKLEYACCNHLCFHIVSQRKWSEMRSENTLNILVGNLSSIFDRLFSICAKGCATA